MYNSINFYFNLKPMCSFFLSITDSTQTAMNTDQSVRTGAYIEHRVQKITTTDLISWSFQVTQGMHYLSTRGVLHGDLAARNVLLCSDRVVKICDFGLSRRMENNADYKKESEVNAQCALHFFKSNAVNESVVNFRVCCRLNGWL